jgi:hypothetical protein
MYRRDYLIYSSNPLAYLSRLFSIPPKDELFTFIEKTGENQSMQSMMFIAASDF